MELGNIEFGKPWKHSDDSPSVAIPILKKGIKKRKYKVLQEVREKLGLKDSGNISKIDISSKSDEPIFIRGGTMFSGVGTQSRAANFGIVIMPNKEKVAIEVSCIHASHPIRTGSMFTLHSTETIVPHRTFSYMLSSSTAGTRPQSSVWGSIGNHSTYSTGETANYFTDDLIRNMEKLETVKKDIDDVITKIPLHENQVGIVIIDLQGVFVIELFDSSESWNAIAKEIFKRYSSKLTETYERPLFKIDEEQLIPTVMNFMKKLTKGDRKVLFKDKSTITYALSTESSVGEYTELFEEVIHIIAMRKEKEEVRQPIMRLSSTRTTEYPYTVSYTTTNSRNGTAVLTAIDSGMDSWSKLKGKLSMSPNTLSSKIKNLESSGFIKTSHSDEDRRNKMYEVTAKGKHLLQKIIE